MDETNNPKKATVIKDYVMYDSIRLFYKNGGGNCYIISVGDFDDDVDDGDSTSGLLGGLEILKKVDEPTMILFPDAVKLKNDGLYGVQQQALSQSAKLMDRVVICDLKKSDNSNHDDNVDEFRNKIGINSLKYGAAYTPWLKAALPNNVKFDDITFERESGSSVPIESLTKDDDIKTLIGYIKEAIKARNDVDSTLVAANSGGADKSLQDKMDTEESDLTTPISTDASVTIDEYKTELRAVYNFIRDLTHDIYTYQTGLAAPGTGDKFLLKTDIGTIFSDNGIVSALQRLIDHSNQFPFTSGDIFTPTQKTNLVALEAGVKAATQTADITAYYADGTNSSEDFYNFALKGAKESFSDILAIVHEIKSTAANYASTFESSLKDAFATYKNSLTAIDESLAEVPPSGAVAGIYSFVDRTRGVHKAPANVSLSNVSGLSVDIDFEDQKDLNVDVNAGKSINAIRTFTGKGILIWGARTLAGNDNEWRYISVRRFYNMAEESIKKSTYWAVFEPNDANTWIRVKAMIENYLTLKWKDGALAGATPEDAFFVKVGLGTTMTSQDILEGRMNVEIGMAVVRPAEFIVLKFSHKMQES